jgi:hypothetical protein
MRKVLESLFACDIRLVLKLEEAFVVKADSCMDFS